MSELIDRKKRLLILLDNLQERFEYIEKQNCWKLSGIITGDERLAVQTARNALEEDINRLERIPKAR